MQASAFPSQGLFKKNPDYEGNRPIVDCYLPGG